MATYVYDASLGNFVGIANTATGTHNSVVGGHSNDVSGNYNSVVGGIRNSVIADYAAISGGYRNHIISNYGVIGGGSTNAVKGRMGVVAGGSRNTATGKYASIPGGYTNTATGDSTLAAGSFTNATNSNSAVFGFSSVLDASNLCPSSEDGQIRFCADSLDLGQVSRIDWGDHLTKLVTELGSTPASANGDMALILSIIAAVISLLVLGVMIAMVSKMKAHTSARAALRT